MFFLVNVNGTVKFKMYLAVICMTDFFFPISLNQFSKYFQLKSTACILI